MKKKLDAGTTANRASSKTENEKKQKHFSPDANLQQARLLEYLQKYQSINTTDARLLLDILHPAGRIKELKNKGYNIQMHWETIDTGLGAHRIGRYVYFSRR